MSAGRFVFYTRNPSNELNAFGFGVSVYVSEMEDPMEVIKRSHPGIAQQCIAYELKKTADEAYARLVNSSVPGSNVRAMPEFVRVRLAELSEEVFYLEGDRSPAKQEEAPAAAVGPKKPPRMVYVTDFIERLNKEQPGELARRAWEATQNIGKGN